MFPDAIHEDKEIDTPLYCPDKYFTMKRILIIFFIITSCMLFSVSAELSGAETFTITAGQAEETNTQNFTESQMVDEPVATMVAFVQEAVSFAQNSSKEDALLEFSDKNGSFFRDNLYIYAYDFDGITLAHPLQTDLIGKSRLEERDAEGELFIENLRDAALNGSGFVVFHYLNPAHNNSVEKKLGYVEKIDDTWWLGSGIYGENVTIPKEAYWNAMA